MFLNSEGGLILSSGNARLGDASAASKKLLLTLPSKALSLNSEISYKINIINRYPENRQRKVQDPV